MRLPYPSDLSDAEWMVLEPLVPVVKPGERPRAHSDRTLIDAMLSVMRGGIAWRALPHEYPPRKTVYHLRCSPCEPCRKVGTPLHLSQHET